jgi:hypothetical protein
MNTYHPGEMIELVTGDVVYVADAKFALQDVNQRVAYMIRRPAKNGLWQTNWLKAETLHKRVKQVLRRVDNCPICGIFPSHCKKDMERGYGFLCRCESAIMNGKIAALATK